MKRLIFFIIFISIPLTIDANELTLDGAIKRAINTHESIKASKEIEKKKEYDLKKAKSDRLFDVTGSYSYTRLKEKPVMRVTGMGNLETSEKDNFSWDVKLTQPVFTGFALSSAQNIAKTDIDISKLDTKTSKLDISYRVKKSYNNLFLAKKALSITEQTVLTLKSHKSDAEKFYNNGLVPYNDLLKAEVSLSNAVQQKEKAIADFDNAKSLLKNLTGLDDSLSFNVKDLEEPKDEILKQEELIKQAIEKRPEIALIKNGIKKLDYAKKIEKSEYLPKLFLVAAYNQAGEDFTAEKNTHVNSHNASLTLKAKWTFFNFNKTSSKINSRLYEKRSLEQKLKEIKKYIKLDVEASLRNLFVAKKNIKTAKKGVNQAKENWRITNIQYKEQTTTSTEVLNAQTYLTNAQTDYYKALYLYWSAMADLERSVGEI